MMKKDYSKQIFSVLMEGKFISRNSSGMRKKLFNEIMENKIEYENLFDFCGYNLEGREGFFFLSKKENATDIERKLEQIYHLVIYVFNFLLTLNSNFGPNFTFTSSDLEKQTVESLELKDLLHEIYPGKDTINDMIEKMCKELESKGFIENISYKDGMWKVLSAFDYLRELQDLITIKD